MTGIEAKEEPVPGQVTDRQWDHTAFSDCMERSRVVREGYWSPFAALAWVASRNEQFVAAVQLYENEVHASRGGLFSGSAWLTIGDEAGERFGNTLTGASDGFRVALEEGKIQGGIARSLETGQVTEIETYRWTEWEVAHIHQGMQILPGFVDFKWPSASVREVFEAYLDQGPEPFATLSAFSGRGSPTPRQAEVFRFFALAPQFMPNGSREMNATDLRSEYLRQFKDGAKFKGKPLERTAFEEMLGRFRDGWRVDGRKWKMSDQSPG